MFGGGGGLDPSKLQQMMDQMGIDVDDIDAEEVVVRTADEELVFDHPDVQRMEAQGQETYQIIGEPTARPRGEDQGGTATGSTVDRDAETDAGADADADADAGAGAGAGAGTDEAGGDAGGDIPDSDVEIVAGRTGASRDEAREALREADGDLAAAVERLE